MATPTLDQLNSWWKGLQQQGLTNSSTGSHISYADLVDTFSKQGVPQAAWMAELYSEGVGFNDAQHLTITPKEFSVGPWQYNIEGGLGSGHPISVLQDPAQESKIAANDMGSMLKKVGLGTTSSISDVMYQLGFNWPGNPTGADNQARTTVAQGFQTLLSGSSVASTGGPQPGPTPGPTPGPPPSSTGTTGTQDGGFYIGPWKVGFPAGPGGMPLSQYFIALIVGILLILGGLAWLMISETKSTVEKHPEIAEAALA